MLFGEKLENVEKHKEESKNHTEALNTALEITDIFLVSFQATPPSSSPASAVFVCVTWDELLKLSDFSCLSSFICNLEMK